MHKQKKKQCGTTAIDKGEYVAFAHFGAQHAREIGTENVEEADEREGRGDDVRRHAAVGKIGGIVRGDKRDVKAAHEKARGEQPIAFMRAGFAERLGE